MQKEEYIDLGVGRRIQNESFRLKRRKDAKINFLIDQSNQAKFGSYVKRLLSAIFRKGTTTALGLKIIGTKSEIVAFVKAIEAEKKYLHAAMDFGLDDLRTYKLKYKLESAVDRFERKTGFRWPLRN